MAETVREGAMRVPQVAEYLGISTRAVWRLLAAGEIPGGWIGACRVVPAEAVRAYLARRVEAAPVDRPEDASQGA